MQTIINADFIFNFKSLVQSKGKDIPLNPGVYVMYNVKKDVLYVGKAKNLHSRLSDYIFQRSLCSRIAFMITQIHTIHLHIANDEKNALYLENLLIRDLDPMFNIKHRHVDCYPYIYITNHKYPGISRFKIDKYLYKYGPFLNSTEANKYIYKIQNIFSIRDCSIKKYHMYKSKNQACDRHAAELCPAPCIDAVLHDDYMESINELNKALTNHKDATIQEYRKKMEQYAIEQEYNKALIYRDRIKLIKQIDTMNFIYPPRIKNIDVVASLRDVYSITKFRDGVYKSYQTYFSDGFNEILDYYISDPPSNIVLIDNKKFIENMPKEIIRYLKIPKKGDKMILIKSAQQRLKFIVDNFALKDESNNFLFKEITKLVNDHFPGLVSHTIRSIECVDNSHISGKFACTGMCNMSIDGNKNFTRIFDWSDDLENCNDDFLMMEKYFIKRFNEHSDDLPDFILLDGGKPQIEAAKRALRILKSTNNKALKIKNIPIFGIAKNPDRIIDVRGNSVDIHDSLLIFMQNIRNNTHNVANGYSVKKSSDLYK